MLAISFIVKGISTLTTFIKEVRIEARKVVWPNRRYVIAATLIILFIVVLTGAFILFIDSAFARLFAYLMKLY
jgi:preprotein translocase subunit SecE